MTTLDTYQQHMAPTYGRPELALVRGEGHTVWADDGRALVDLLAGIAVNALGHAHPAIVQAVTDQVQTLGHVSNLYATEPAAGLMRRLHERTGLPRAFLCNSGTEANEYALKLARARAVSEGLPTKVIAFEGSFHGRTFGSLSLTGQPKHQQDLGPLLPDIHHVPYIDVGAVEDHLDEDGAAAVFLEVVQGEGGVLPASVDAARAVARACRRTGALLIVDEVQTGVHRTGAFLASQLYDLKPDVVTLAKGLGGGLPIGAACAKEEVAAHLGPGRHGCTFGGNPVSAAAANATLDTLDEMKVDRLVEELHGPFRDIGMRGLGLLLGLPLQDNAKLKAAQRTLLDAGYLVGSAGDRVLRIAPPLILPQDVADEAARAIAKVRH